MLGIDGTVARPEEASPAARSRARLASGAATLGQALRAAAARAPAAVAFRYGGEVLTYGEWDHLADAVAAALRAYGVGRGSVVALLLPSTPFYLVAYLAAARLGAATTGINVRYRRTEIRHILRQSAAEAILVVDSWHGVDFARLVAELHPELSGLRIVPVAARALRSDTRRVVEGLNPPAAPPLEQADPDDPVAIVFTSGTTGAPKGAWYSHRRLMAVAEIESARYGRGAQPPRKHLAAGVSFAHVGTMVRIGFSIAHCVETIVHDSFDPAAALEAIEAERLEQLAGFPTQVRMLLDHPDLRRRDLSSLRSVVLGGSRVPAELIEEIRGVFGAEVSVRYSSTEVGIATASLPGDPPDAVLHTVGKPAPGVQLRIVDESNAPLPPGASGEIAVRSPATMCGYWRDPEGTAAAIDAEGWVHTGDIGFLDDHGYLHLLGRRTEMFIRGGFNVHPGEVEERLRQHPKVADAAVVGFPDQVLGEIGWAFIVPRDSTDPPSLGELRDFVGAELASFKRPDRLAVVPALPVTPMYKVDRAALRELAAAMQREGGAKGE